MKLSIIIPVYNVESYIGACLDSVVKQQLENKEVICVDDGSTDKSLSILRKYQKRYSFIRIYSKFNGGLSSARNYGIKRAKGDYLFFLDSDDLLADENCLSYMCNKMEQEGLDVLYFDAKSFFEDNDIRRKNIQYEKSYQREKSYGIYKKGEELFSDFVKNNDYYVQSSLQCLKRSYVKENGLFFPEGILYEDNLFMFKSMLLAGKVMHINRIVMLHRIRRDSIMQSALKYINLYSLIYTYHEMMQFWREHKKDMSGNKEIQVIVNGVKLSSISMYYRLDIMERRYITGLASYDQYIIRELVAAREKEDDNIIFPYYLFAPGKSVVIYGVGYIGKKIYKKAIRDNTVKIVGIVDSNAEKIEKNNIPVLPKKALEEMDYDYILIAVESPIIAREIEKQLIEAGIPQYKLKWDQVIYLRKDGREYEYWKFSTRLMQTTKKRFFLLMLPEHGNLGDHVIAIAEEKFLKDYFPNHTTISVTTNEFIALQDYFLKEIRQDDIILLQGGGYIGDLWENGKEFRKIIKLFPDNIKIVFPNSLAYENDYKKNSEYTKNDLKNIYQDNNLYIFFRDIESFLFYKHCGYIKRCYYFPDMALYLSAGYFKKVKGSKKHRVLLCFRNDKERIFQGERIVKSTLAELGLLYDERDTHLNQYTPKIDEEEHINRLMCEICDSELVITDRIHGMILAAICGTPCIAFDNLTHKVFSFYRWLQNRKNIMFCTNEKLNDLSQYVISAMSEGKTEPVSYKDKFDKMAEIIKKITSM